MERRNFDAFFAFCIAPSDERMLDLNTRILHEQLILMTVGVIVERVLLISSAVMVGST
jgi:hypothetical protein